MIPKSPPEMIEGNSISRYLQRSSPEIFQGADPNLLYFMKGKEATKEYSLILQRGSLKLFVPGCRVGPKEIPSSEIIV